jgi:hypothetical protein
MDHLGLDGTAPGLSISSTMAVTFSLSKALRNPLMTRSALASALASKAPSIRTRRRADQLAHWYPRPPATGPSMPIMLQEPFGEVNESNPITLSGGTVDKKPSDRGTLEVCACLYIPLYLLT